MNNKTNWLETFKQSINNFIAESKQKNLFEIVDIINCDTTSNKLAVLKLQGHYTKTMAVKDIVFNDDIINGLPQQAVRALTYLHAIEQLAPEFTIENIQLNAITEDYIVTLKSKHQAKHQTTLQHSAVDLSKDANLIKKLNPKDANRIGYMAGVKATVDEFALKNEIEIEKAESNGKI